ncbi:MAG: DUF4893 domain-containing protein [Sphingomonadales bacterium]
MYRVLSKRCFALVFALVVGGCTQRHVTSAASHSVVEVSPVDPNSWAAIATDDDADRLKRLDAAWASALAEARPRNATAITREGALLDPAGALTRAAPSPGQYRCRVVALGRGTDRRGPVFRAFKPQTCFVQAEEKLFVLMKATGTTLPGGRLWEDGDKRMIFLGAMADKPGAAAPAYGSDPRRDRAGVFERVGDFRWRLVTPWQVDGPTLEVMELVPETPPPPPPPTP